MMQPQDSLNDQMHPVNIYLKQRQDSLNDQMRSVSIHLSVNAPAVGALLDERFASPFTAQLHDLADLTAAKQAATKLGCYDAADWIDRQIQAIR